MTTPPRRCMKCSSPAVPYGSRCEAHGGNTGWVRYKQRNPAAAAFYASGGWRRARQDHLRLNPNCAHCGAKASAVDHIRPRAEGGGDLDPTNLQSLCERHHREKTLDESHRGMKRNRRRQT